MSRFDSFKAAYREIEVLERQVSEWRTELKANPATVEAEEFLLPLAESRISALKALFDEPTPPPVEPVKPKAKRGDVDGAVKEQLVALAENGSGPEHIDWATWARDHKLNRKSVLAAVRRHTEKNKT